MNTDEERVNYSGFGQTERFASFEAQNTKCPFKIRVHPCPSVVEIFWTELFQLEVFLVF